MEMKIDVRLLPIVEDLQEKASKLLARGATQSMPAPDGPHGVFAPISFLENGPELVLEGLRFA
jgi:hypothetical protein